MTMAENNTTYYQSRHTGAQIDDLLDQSIAATEAANAASQRAETAAASANEEAAKIPDMVAGKASLDPATGYVEPSQLAPLLGRQTGVRMGGGHFRSADAALLPGGDISVAVTLRIGALPTATTFIFADQSGANLTRLFFAAYNGKVVARFATQTLIDRSVEADSLYQLVVSIRKGGQMSGYVNTIPYTTRTDVSSPSEPDVIVVGGTTRNTELFDGTLLGLRIFDYALTAAEVAALWNGGAPERYMLPPSGAMRAGLVGEYIPAGLLTDKWRDTSGRGADLSYVPLTAGSPAELDYRQQPLTPSGSPLHDLFTAAGAVWDDTAKSWSVADYTGIDTPTMAKIFAQSNNALNGSVWDGMLMYSSVPTNFPPIGIISNYFTAITSARTAFTSSAIEVANIARTDTAFTGFAHLGYAFRGCERLRRIRGIIYLGNDVNVAGAFDNCPKLEQVKVQNLRKNIAFAQSAMLSLETLQYLVENAANTAAITVTVHADVYAKLTDPANTEWYAVNTAAQARQISFATV